MRSKRVYNRSRSQNLRYPCPAEWENEVNTNQGLEDGLEVSSQDIRENK